MNTPPALIGVTLVFWGWQAGLLWISVAAAVILEGSRLVGFRWELSRPDLKRVIYLCDLALIGVFAYSVFRHGLAGFVEALMFVLRAVPLIVFPVIVAQAYSTANTIDVTMLMLVSRKRQRPPRPVDVSYPYFAICLLAAGAANARTPWFYAGFAVLLAWVLWMRRPRIFSPVIWAIVLVFAGAAGYVGHIQLNRLQVALEDMALSFYSEADADPYKSKTAIGHIGSLKLSDRILFRVRFIEGGRQAPLLLADASYNFYHASSWFGGSLFRPIKPEPGGTNWRIQDVSLPKQSVNISGDLRRGKGLLALPRGPVYIENLPAREVSQNGFGSIAINDGPAHPDFTVRFDRDAVHQLAPPKNADLKVPENLSPVLTKIAEDLQLRTKTPQERAQAVTRYFHDSFSYATYQAGIAKGLDPIEDFLVRSHSGHCEYFATATVLLLRAAGVPARYATGYSVQEPSQLEKAYVVRSRHAHAWALAYIDGAWRDIDTTPSTWAEKEDPHSRFTALWDRWSWLVMNARTLWDKQDGRFAYLAFIVVPVLVVLGLRLYRKRKLLLRKTKKERDVAAVPRQGTDSEFYAVEKELIRQGFARKAWEPPGTWVGRIGPDAAMSERLREIVSLHNRYRFDPDGLNPKDRQALKEAAQAWLAGIDKR